MPQENLFGPFQEAMRLAVSQGISERNLAASERDKASTLALLREKMEADTAEKQSALAERKRLDQSKILEKFINHAAETGNKELFQGLVGQLEQSQGVQWPRGPQPDQVAGMGPQTGIPPYLMPGRTVKQFAPASGQDDLTRALLEKLGPEGAAAALRPRATPQEKPLSVDQQVWDLIDQDPATPSSEKLKIFADWKAAQRPRTEGEGSDEKKKKTIESEIARLNSQIENINSGTGIMDQALASGRPVSIANLQAQREFKAKEYEALGGKRERLGLGAPAAPGAAPAYKNPYDVKAAFKSGKLTKEEAAKILRDQFGAE